MCRMYRELLLCALSVTVSAGAGAQSIDMGDRPEKASLVTQRQVRATLMESLRGTNLEALNFSEADVVVSAVPVKVPAPDLQVVRVTADPKRGVIDARLRCLRQECLPFCASVRPVTLPTSVNGQPFSILMSPRTERSGRLSKARPPLVSAGDAAKLFVVTPGIRISIPVICLQPGGVGQFIRLRAVTTGKVLMGKVESKGVLSSQGAGQ